MAMTRFPEEFEDCDGLADGGDGVVEEIARRVVVFRETSLHGLMDR